MSDRRYSARILWSDEDQGYVARVPELEGVSAFGLTPGVALEELAVAREVWLEELGATEQAPPAPALLPYRSGQFRVRLPRSLHDWLAERAEVEGVSLNTWIVQLLSEARGARVARIGGDELGRTA